MKVGVLTRRDGYNIGTSLQAYAMQYIVSNLCSEYKIIDYCEYSWRARLKYFILNIGGLMFLPFKKSIYRIGYEQRHKFDCFDKRLNKTFKKYHYSISSSINNEFDAFICGSDQIWNPKQLTPAFLFNFVKNEKKKISYAPSIGVNNSCDFSDSSIDLIKRFDYLSCREYDGAEVIEKITNKKCRNVLDPTLLVDRAEWQKLEKVIDVPSRYILCYFLGDDNYPINYVEKLAKNNDCKILNVRMFYNSKNAIGEDLFVSPEEFLFLVKNAVFVCTNSYHGTIFSIIYRKWIATFAKI